VTADTTVASWFETRPGMPLARIRSVRHRIDSDDALPLCWSEIYVREEFSGIFDHLDKSTGPVYRILQQVYDVDITRVEVEVGAVTMKNPEAEYLSVAENTPAVRVLRRYYDGQGKVFETSISLHPEDRFSYKLTFKNAPNP